MRIYDVRHRRTLSVLLCDAAAAVATSVLPAEDFDAALPGFAAMHGISDLPVMSAATRLA